jgi:hypothetical protein
MKNLTILFLLFIYQYAHSQGIGIGSTNPPHPSAALDVNSTNKGMLVPRLTETQKVAIAAPAQGLLIYNTTSNSFQYYNGSIWINITNSGIVTGTSNRVSKFVGSWGLQNSQITDDGSGVSINTTGANPHASAMLDVQSNTKGILIPRMTSAERTAIASPLKGLLVFDNITSSFWFYNGTAWEQASLNNQWAVNGSSISYSGGRVGIGTNNPQARMAVDSSLMVDQSNSNQGFLDKGALYFGSDKKVGIIRSFLTGSAGRSGLGFFTNSIRRMTIDSTGQVGIGTINPLQALHVSGNTYLSGYLGIGSSMPDYAFENLHGYNYMFYGLGVGTVPNSTYLLDVGTGSSNSRFRGDVSISSDLTVSNNLLVNNNLQVNNNGVVDGSLTVNNGKGVAYNANSGTNLRIYQFTTATFGAVLPGFGLSAEGNIAFNGGFTGTPRVFVGDIDVTGGSSGELYRVQLQLYGCSTTSGTTTCKARLLNTSPNSVNYTITWNCMAIGN